MLLKNGAEYTLWPQKNLAVIFATRLFFTLSLRFAGTVRLSMHFY